MVQQLYATATRSAAPTERSAADSGLHPCCRLSGQLIYKDIGYALHRADGECYWLEMDSIPQHLIEREVSIVGRRYGRDLIWVESIGPVEASS